MTRKGSVKRWSCLDSGVGDASQTEPARASSEVGACVSVLEMLAMFQHVVGLDIASKASHIHSVLLEPNQSSIFDQAAQISIEDSTFHLTVYFDIKITNPFLPLSRWNRLFLIPDHKVHNRVRFDY